MGVVRAVVCFSAVGWNVIVGKKVSEEPVATGRKPNERGSRGERPPSD